MAEGGIAEIDIGVCKLVLDKWSYHLGSRLAHLIRCSIQSHIRMWNYQHLSICYPWNQCRWTLTLCWFCSSIWYQIVKSSSWGAEFPPPSWIPSRNLHISGWSCRSHLHLEWRIWIHHRHFCSRWWCYHKPLSQQSWRHYMEVSHQLGFCIWI